MLLEDVDAVAPQSTEAALLALIDEWASEGRTILLVLHDLSAVLQHCTSSLLLGNGQARFGDPRSNLSPANLIEHGYLSAGQATWMEAMYANAGDRPDV